MASALTPNDQRKVVCALDPAVISALWQAIYHHLPEHVDDHPLGCHGKRVPDLLCFRGILIRLVTGSSWEDVEALMEFKVSDTTLRARCDEWIAAGVCAELEAETRAGYDRINGLDLSFVAIDGANRNDLKLLEPTLDSIITNGLLDDIELLALDRGYDYPVVRQRPAGHCLVELEIQKRGTQPPPGTPSSIASGWARMWARSSWRHPSVTWPLAKWRRASSLAVRYAPRRLVAVAFTNSVRRLTPTGVLWVEHSTRHRAARCVPRARPDPQ